MYLIEIAVQSRQTSAGRSSFHLDSCQRDRVQTDPVGTMANTDETIIIICSSFPANCTMASMLVLQICIKQIAPSSKTSESDGEIGGSE
jgi:hypothetical protein